MSPCKVGRIPEEEQVRLVSPSTHVLQVGHVVEDRTSDAILGHNSIALNVVFLFPCIPRDSLV